MKKYTFSLLLLITTLLYSCVDEKTYCGNVTEKFTSELAHGKGQRHYSTEAWVVFFSDSLQRKVPVKVNWTTYVNAEVGKRICFELSEHELNR